MEKLQKVASKVFITASVLFGIAGILILIASPEQGDPPHWQMKILGSLVFIILSSFGVSVGAKYLYGKK